MHKLLTKEDRFHLHKTLGLLSIVSFIHHYGRFLLTGSFGHVHPSTMGIHVCLSLTSLFFRVPKRRIRKLPTTIWEEYRLHAIVFTCRGLCVYLTSGLMWRACAVLLVHVCADVVTAYHGECGNTTVRGDSHRPPRSLVVRVLIRMYSFYQVLALGSHLIAGDGRGLGYNTMIGIQSSAFCMTLHRKGLIRWQTHALVYSLCILLSSAYILCEMPWILPGVCVVYVLRTVIGMNKYVLWSLYTILMVR